MIKINKVDEEIALALKAMKEIKDAGTEPKDDPIGRKHIKNLEWLKCIRMYLETKPRAEFVVNERDRIEHRIDLIKRGVEDIRRAYKKDCIPMRDEIREYQEANQFQKLKRQLKTLNYIIG